MAGHFDIKILMAKPGYQFTKEKSKNKINRISKSH
jgi:hypothetical protein